ncbi:MAG: ATP-binding protein [Bacteroidota bacterium]
MFRKRFRLNLTFRTVLIVGTSLLLGLVIFKSDLFIIPFLLTALLIGQLLEMLWYVDRSNRDLTLFLQSIQHDDFVTGFQTRERGPSFDLLYDEFDRISLLFRDIRAEKASQFHLLQEVMDHVDVGLICFSPQAEIKIVNTAFLRLLNRQYIPNLDSLASLFPELHAQLTRIQPGSKALLRIQVQGQELELALRATQFILQDVEHTLVSVQNIQEELEARDLEAWQKLIRILTHEIMNSVTPILSLTDTLLEVNGELQTELKSEESAENLEDMQEGLSAIQARSRGLMHFTKAYRDLTRIPPPQLESVDITVYLRRISTLLGPECKQAGVSLDITLPPTPLFIKLDPDLMEQVFINLIRNGIEVQHNQESAGIKIMTGVEGNKLRIQVADQGPGIDTEEIGRIFIPFYTTKENGSGIGLSLSRQILSLHGGRITVRNHPQGGAVFTMSLPYQAEASSVSVSA